MENYRESIFVLGRYQNDETKIDQANRVSELLQKAGYDFVTYINHDWPCEIFVKARGKKSDIYNIFNSVHSVRYKNVKQGYYLLPEYRTACGGNDVLGNVQFVSICRC